MLTAKSCKEYFFLTKDDLIQQLKKDKACLEGIILCREKVRAYSDDGRAKTRPITLDEILERCPYKYRIWCIAHGYVQFLEHLNIHQLQPIDAFYIIYRMPKYYNQFKFLLTQRQKDIINKKYNLEQAYDNSDMPLS